jgi:hypothetical protein
MSPYTTPSDGVILQMPANILRNVPIPKEADFSQQVHSTNEGFRRKEKHSRFLQVLDILLTEREVTKHVVFNSLDGAHADDRTSALALGPGKCDLGHGRSVFLGQLLNAGDDRFVGVGELHSHRIVFVDIAPDSVSTDGTAEVTGSQRGPRDESDAIIVAIRKHFTLLIQITKHQSFVLIVAVIDKEERRTHELTSSLYNRFS